ncbi:MAG: hypothetical protein P4L36_06765 [Holophaga sp.]|nr:hypothetical protein [Holophaga sp.]
MRVRNVMEREPEGCRCGTWLQHWDTFSRQRANFCMVVDCNSKPEVGGQVRKEGQDRVYIVPLCRACAAKAGQLLEVVNNVNLVPADLEETCARKAASGY